MSKPEYEQVLHKNYKLWLESVDILNQIMNRKLFVDCEALFFDIEDAKKEFVKTTCYDKANDILDKKGMLLLLGAPGVGKTMTTKMLALEYAAKDYTIRYNSGNHLRDIKRSLSADLQKKELVILDDCFGQRYFEMKEEQENELVDLLKYISMYSAKKLLMNSRIVIYNEAQKRSREFVGMVENHRIEIDILDMKEMTVVDKAQILYNHLYFKGIPTDYFQNIKTNKAYRAIVSHKNYTPRIIEYVTLPWIYNKIPAKEYASFIMNCLACPDEIWHEEFTERLTQADRIFMTTLFSLTDKCVDVTIHRRAYEKRLSNTPGIDVTKNQWEETHRRLYNSMVIDVNLLGTRCLSVVNPSVNDFLSFRAAGNE